MEEDIQTDPEVSSEVDLEASSEVKKSINQVAKEVLAGHWGRGNVRNGRLLAAGYEPREVNKEIESILK